MHHRRRTWELIFTPSHLDQAKLELITGIPVQNQQISVCPNEDESQAIAHLADDSKPLGFYGVRDWQVLKVSSTDLTISLGNHSIKRN